MDSSSALGRPTRKSVLRAARKQRPRIDKIVHARALDKFLDARPDASASLQAETTFDVGTLAKNRNYYPDPGAVTFLEPPGQGGIIGSGSPGCRAKDGADTLIATRHAELFAEVDRLLQEGPQGADHELVVETDGDFHPYRGVSQPQPTHLARPVSMGANLGDKLITPQERRLVHEFEKKTKMAEQLFRKAQSDRARALEVLRTRYPNGVLGVDSPNNLESSIYGHRAEQLERVRAQTAEVRKRRADKIAYLSDSRVSRGFDLLTLETVPGDGGEDNGSEQARGVLPMFQSRHRVESAPGRNHNTHQRLFAREFIRPRGVRRNKALMRDFDIVTGAAIPEKHRRPSDGRVLALDVI
ncbi:Hypothetical Protein FCC1311_086352 [Hondaea fermentalgiana]|uniref:Uncharacterized protein n=1 Tax=Hondaea fermentalgiana TaxID=2315210 RepID=A0A2R5GNF2_9STRA|nr:Hypothetical Protein FCC1311_086352 [Hondaea fermentalgiana]|eukprot:GBG32410.1 Hypothetical Protein FCC1311_086352 [Hondaea fermentalgiana]